MTTATPTPVTDSTLPSIRNRSLLVALSFNKPQMTKLDHKASHDAEAANNAKGAIKAQKLLYPKHLIDPIIAKEAEIRNYLKTHTTSFGSTGLFLLDTSMFMQVSDRLSRYEVERAQLVTVFAQNWSNVIAQAETQQGDLFDPSVYPDVSEVVGQFKMTVSYFPVGDISRGLFDDVEQELRDTIAQEVERSTKDVMAQALRQPFERLLDSVLNIYDRTSRDDTQIRDSLMEHLDSITSLMPALNVLGLEQLNKLAERCRERLYVPPETLRGKDNDERARVATEAKAIISACGIDPTQAQKLSPTERKELAQRAADGILAKMRGMA
jgi:hypothetical protein